MINFPKYQSITNVVQAVELNVAATQPGAEQLPTVGYIGFAEPSGLKVIIEIDNTGTVVGTSTKVAASWADENSTALNAILSNLTTAHGALPDNITLTLVGYINDAALTLIDAQLVVDKMPSVYWLSVTVMNQLVAGVDGVTLAFAENSVYTEIDFNTPEVFIKAAIEAADGVPTLWQISPHTEFAIAPVLRDPYRIAL